MDAEPNYYGALAPVVEDLMKCGLPRDDAESGAAIVAKILL